MTIYESHFTFTESIKPKDHSLLFSFIPKNEETFLCSTYGRLKFHHSVNFKNLSHYTIVKPFGKDDKSHKKIYSF